MKNASSAETLRAQVYQTLRETLRTGAIGPSQTMTERDLAEQLGVSRTPVREALVLLAHEGLVAFSTRGFSTPKLSARDIEDLFQVRRMLEPGALASTIDHLNAHDFRALRQAISDQEAADAAGDVEAFVAAGSNFRAIWLAAVPNSRLRN